MGIEESSSAIAASTATSPAADASSKELIGNTKHASGTGGLMSPAQEITDLAPELEEEPVLVDGTASPLFLSYVEVDTDSDSEDEGEFSDEEDYDTEEETDEDFDEFLAERRQILSDARALRHLAIAFLHPELPVVTSDAAARARCYFNRASAFEQESVEESEARTQILADAAALKMHAIMYAHPELPVVTSDATSTARCYFDRASAFEQESVEESEERAQILADSAALKERAIMYAHPELPVVTSDATATARCYFDRASAFEQESVEESEERAQILADSAALKERAIMYAHPELPVITSDATSTARCYFDRASAFEQESVEESEERAQILADSAALKERAIMYAHPELPVVTSDATATARCYFDRASAFEQESVEESEERAQILADSAALKERAIMYAHPELPVVTSDATATARCYFDRASAFEQESVDESEERAQILADSAALKERAIMYAHPELPVVTSDATATARCYFDRASAFEQESVEESEERAQILADSAALKERAIMYAHPELPVITSDATATARCYFDRASATYDEEIVSTHAYSKAEKKEERLETTLQSLEALAESTGIKAPAASGPEARMPRSASNVQLFDLQDTA